MALISLIILPTSGMMKRMRPQRIAAMNTSVMRAAIEDGILYFKTYDKSGDLSHITADYVRERIIPQDDPEFPYYYPMDTTMGFLSFRVEDLPNRKENTL